MRVDEGSSWQQDLGIIKSTHGNSVGLRSEEVLRPGALGLTPTPSNTEEDHMAPPDLDGSCTLVRGRRRASPARISE